MILVDADACPVKSEVEKVATRHGLPVVLVCDGGIRPSRNPLVTLEYVTEGLDAADDRIVERAGAGDIVVTADIPLADRALARGARVIGFDGEEFTSRNIAGRLAARNAADARRAETPLATPTASRVRPPDRGRFANALERLVREVLRNGR